MKFNYLLFWSDQKAYIFLKAISNIFYQTDPNFLEVKLGKIKTSFDTILLRPVTPICARKNITIT